jgi:hypothetical protein
MTRSLSFQTGTDHLTRLAKIPNSSAFVQNVAEKLIEEVLKSRSPEKELEGLKSIRRTPLFIS